MEGASISFERRNDEFVGLTDEELAKHIEDSLGVVMEIGETMSTTDCRMIVDRVRVLEEERRKRINSIVDLHQESGAAEGAFLISG